MFPSACNTRKRRIMKKHLILCIMLTCICSALLACDNNYVPDDVTAFYQDFLETAKTDHNAAVRQYCYFKHPEEYDVVASSTDFLLSYKIHSWEQLSNDLWAVQVSINSINNPDGHKYFHFVGRFDDRFWIMLGTTRIPDTLKEGCDLNQYINKNAVEYKDIIK